MADSTTQSLTIDAAPERIMAVIADFPAYPEWAGAVHSAEVLAVGENGLASEVAFGLDAGVFKDAYTLSYDWAPDGLSVSWRLTKGQIQKAQQGSYVLEPVGGSTTVTYSLSVELNIPMIGMLRRKAEKIIIDTALRELKRRVEQ
ncbi:SRPBCC family protein [Pseudonocardia spinosispora]|uniref:SRPBCC family protein n=1 Tax=Pseudonocardia spinosispora TaxID=103441 RepID=UPI0003F77A5A|nr:SRPBCC family protein [Pseudonocardia spinosispora]